jgi:hypothetical protein
MQRSGKTFSAESTGESAGTDFFGALGAIGPAARRDPRPRCSRRRSAGGADEAERGEVVP